MGADGHIEIYDETATREKFPEFFKNDKASPCIGGYVYNDPWRFERQVRVGYWGDNMSQPTIRENEHSPPDEFDRKYYGDELLSAREVVVAWMREDAVLVSDWEVWT